MQPTFHPFIYYLFIHSTDNYRALLLYQKLSGPREAKTIFLLMRYLESSGQYELAGAVAELFLGSVRAQTRGTYQGGVWECFLEEVMSKLNFTGRMTVWEEGKGSSHVRSRGERERAGLWELPVIGHGACWERRGWMCSWEAAPGCPPKNIGLDPESNGGPLVDFRQDICIILLGF